MDMSRRGFMELAGSVMLLGDSGAVNQQLEPQGLDGDLDAYGLVLDNNRPPVDRIKEEWDTFRFVHLHPVTGEKHYATHLRNTWTEIPPAMDIAQYGTPYDSLKTAQQYTQFALDPSKDLTRRRYQWFSNNTLFDKTHLSSNDGVGSLDISTGAGANTARIHSAIAGQYISQSLAQPGIGLDVADANITRDSNNLSYLSHGSLALGVGWHDKSAGGWGVNPGPIQTFLGIRYSDTGAEAVLVANGEHIGDSPVKQEDWNLDTMDGSGGDSNPSGEVLKPETGYVYQFPYTWYGHGALYVGLSSAQSEDVIHFHKFTVPRTSFDRPNMPPLVVADDGGTGSDLTARIGGMQYALYGSQLGEEGTEERGSEITRTDFGIATQSVDSNNGVDPVSEPGDPIISFKRVGGVRDMALRLDNFFASLDAPMWVFSWDEYEPATALTGANFVNPNEAVYPDDETKILVDKSATDYTPTTAVSRGIDYISTDKNQESLSELSTDDRIPIDATRVITAAHEGTQPTVDPAQIRVVEGF